MLRGGLQEPENARVSVADTETGTIYESSVRFYSLYTTGHVRVKWVEDLASHLTFDQQYLTLSVFCLPSICASNIMQRHNINVLEQHVSFAAEIYVSFNCINDFFRG